MWLLRAAWSVCVCVCVDLRRRFERAPVSATVELGSPAQLQCLPPIGAPQPTVSQISCLVPAAVNLLHNYNNFTTHPCSIVRRCCLRYVKTL